MSEPKRPHGSRFRDAPVIVSPGASGIAHSIVEACREHEPAESTTQADARTGWAEHPIVTINRRAEQTAGR